MKGNKDNKMTERIIAGVLAGIMILSAVAAVLIYLI